MHPAPRPGSSHQMTPRALRTMWPFSAVGSCRGVHPQRRATSCTLPTVSIKSVPCHVSSARRVARSEEHTSELQSQSNLVCRLLLEKKKKIDNKDSYIKPHAIGE